MKKVKVAIFIILGILAALVLGVLALIYIPSPKFKPVTYKPIAPDYWPTEGFRTSTQEEQGMLYLQQGQWDGRQIVPAAWDEESITPHAYPKNYVDVLDENGEKDYEASQTNWVSAKFFRPFSDGYGYQWWLDKNGAYNALGTSGQYIMIAPEENLVVVATSSASGMGAFLDPDASQLPNGSAEIPLRWGACSLD